MERIDNFVMYQAYGETAGGSIPDLLEWVETGICSRLRWLNTTRKTAMSLYWKTAEIMEKYAYCKFFPGSNKQHTLPCSVYGCLSVRARETAWIWIGFQQLSVNLTDAALTMWYLWSVCVCVWVSVILSLKYKNSHWKSTYMHLNHHFGLWVMLK